MSRSGRDDDRLSESYKQRFRDLEGRTGRQAYTLEQQERKIFELTNGLRITENALEQRDDELRAAQADVIARDQRLLALAQHFGYDSVAEAEKAPAPSNTQLVNDLKAARAKISKLSSRERQFHEAQVETLARVEETEGEVARLEQQVGFLQSADVAQREAIRKLEEVERGHETTIKELEERLQTPPSPTIQADKENRILQSTHTPLNSAPSTPTKPRPPDRVRGLSLSPHKSPSKLSTVRLLNTHKALEAEHKHLTQQYSALVNTHNAVSTAYAADKRKWRALKDWLYGDDKAHREQKAELTEEEQRKYEQERWERKRRRFIQVHKDLKGRKEGSTEVLGKPEDTSQAAGSARAAEPSMVTGLPRGDTIFLDPLASSPTSLTPTKRPQPGPSTEDDRSVPAKRVRRFTQASSDTEEDSQALPLHRKSSTIYKSPTRSPKRPAFASAAPPPSSDVFATTTTTVMNQSSNSVKHEPSSPVLSPVRPRRTVAAATAYATPVSVARPAPVRVKEEFVEGSSATPLQSRSAHCIPSDALSGPAPSVPVSTAPSFATPIDKSHRKGDMAPPAGDYSAYKGRGRYGRARPVDPGADADMTINAAYEINPEQNGGQNFAFDEVVRGRAERMRLPAGDCMECRAYYEGIGELPERLQRPRWRSPSADSADPARGLCPHHAHGTLPAPDFAAIEQHKAGVSRHRARWPRGSTPPGFWDIGMPDTQEQAAINERAEEMRHAKRREVEAEAEREGGRWRKR